MSAALPIWTLALLGWGCDPYAPPDNPVGTPTPPPEEPGEGAEADDPPASGWAASARADLRVKRWRQLALDLSGALAIPEDLLCAETGRFDCMSIHVIPLGGVSVANGLYEPVPDLPVTYGLAVERVAIQSCWSRLTLDEAGDPEVFTHLSLDGASATAEELDAQTTELYRRFLARDPRPEELARVVDFHREVTDTGGGNAEWAALSCFALATSTEFLMY